MGLCLEIKESGYHATPGTIKAVALSSGIRDSFKELYCKRILGHFTSKLCDKLRWADFPWLSVAFLDSCASLMLAIAVGRPNTWSSPSLNRRYNFLIGDARSGVSCSALDGCFHAC